MTYLKAQQYSVTRKVHVLRIPPFTHTNKSLHEKKKRERKTKKDSLYYFIFTRSERFKEFFNFYKRQILTVDLNTAGKAKIRK